MGNASELTDRILSDMTEFGRLATVVRYAAVRIRCFQCMEALGYEDAV